VTTINPDSSITEEEKPLSPNIEKTEVSKMIENVFLETEKSDDKSPPPPTTIFVTTINPDSSITEENKPITPTTPNTNDDKHEPEEIKFIPLERKRQYTFIVLISNPGQEVLKSKDFIRPIFYCKK
jgi:hypothetical protein